MIENYFFEIPIYTMQPSEYENIRQKELEHQYLRYVSSSSISKKEFEPFFKKNLWRPWEYNQIIGWIALFVFGKDIRGHYYLADSKRRNYRLVKKRFEYMGKVFECGFYKPCNPEDIFIRLRERILSCNKDFKGKAYIDLAASDNIGPLIKWDSLLGY